MKILQFVVLLHCLHYLYADVQLIVDAVNPALTEIDNGLTEANAKINDARDQAITKLDKDKDEAKDKLKEAKDKALETAKTDKATAEKEMNEAKDQHINPIVDMRTQVDADLDAAKADADLLVENAAQRAIDIIVAAVNDATAAGDPKDQIDAKETDARDKIEEKKKSSLEAVVKTHGDAKRLYTDTASPAIEALNEIVTKTIEEIEKLGVKPSTATDPKVKAAEEKQEDHIKKARDEGLEKIETAGNEAESQLGDDKAAAENKVKAAKKEALELAASNPKEALEKMNSGSEHAKEYFADARTSVEEKITTAHENAKTALTEAIEKSKDAVKEAAKKAKEAAAATKTVEATKFISEAELTEIGGKALKALEEAFTRAKNKAIEIGAAAEGVIITLSADAMEEVNAKISKEKKDEGGEAKSTGTASEQVRRAEEARPTKDSNCFDEWGSGNCHGKLPLCKNTAYFKVMHGSCRKTCGECVDNTFECEDRFTPDCDRMGQAFCASKAYTKGMKIIQCAKYCNLCPI